MPMGRPKKPKRMATVLLSGGIDSTACVHFCLARGHAVAGMFVDYGQVARRREERAAGAGADAFEVPLRKLRVLGTASKGAGLVQGRNAFLVLCALMEIPKGPQVLAIGIHGGTPYWDCSQGFVTLMQSLLDGYAGGRVQLLAPFVTWTKQEVFLYCREHDLPIELTYSCERGVAQPCGQCSSCRDLEALNAGK